MRSFLSYLAGAATLVCMMAVGGAWSPISNSQLVRAQVDPLTVRQPFVGDIPTPDVPEPTRVFPGCQPPLIDAACVTVAVGGGLDVPMSAADFVPVDVASVDDWRPLVGQFFEPTDVDRAIRVISCESGGDPLAANPTSSARGLFQHLGSMWAERTAKAGMGDADIFDPVDNVRLAAWLVYQGGGWSHWYPSRHCWG